MPITNGTLSFLLLKHGIIVDLTIKMFQFMSLDFSLVSSTISLGISLLCFLIDLIIFSCVFSVSVGGFVFRPISLNFIRIVRTPLTHIPRIIGGHFLRFPFFHFAALRAKFAFFFIAGEASGSFNTDRAFSCMPILDFFAALVKLPRLDFLITILDFFLAISSSWGYMWGREALRSGPKIDIGIPATIVLRRSDVPVVLYPG